MDKELLKDFIPLETQAPIWDRFFMVAPLVVIGTKEGKGYDLAPKHMATPLGHSNYFGFVCTPSHATYHNVKKTGEFAVSFPLPDQIALASLSASPRSGQEAKSKDILQALPTIKTLTIDALFIGNSYLYLECQLFKIIDGFDAHSFITGKISAAYVHKEYQKVSDADEQLQMYQHPLLAYVANGRFAKLSETFNFPFPKDFKR
ncbi:flavin reductase [Flavobacteriaceae bacterium 3-367]